MLINITKIGTEQCSHIYNTYTHVHIFAVGLLYGGGSLTIS